MKSFFDSIYHFDYVLFLIKWTLALSLMLDAYLALHGAYFQKSCSAHLPSTSTNSHVTTRAVSFLKRNQRIIEMIKFRPKTEAEEKKQPAAVAPSKPDTTKLPDAKKSAGD